MKAAMEEQDPKRRSALNGQLRALYEQRYPEPTAQHQEGKPPEGQEPIKTTLQVPGGLTEEQSAVVAPIVAELGKLPGGESVPTVELQRGVNLVAQLETLEAPGTSYDSLERGHVALVRQHGPEGARAIMGQAMKAAAVLPDSLVAYLETSGLGYRPSVLVALASMAGGEFKHTPQSAKGKLQGKDLTKLQQHILGLIAAEEP
jgi:hypothetical protein